MASRIGKRQSYEELFQRQDTALALRFFLEASWIAYAILEDRADSALGRTGGPVHKKRPMLGEKLEELKKRMSSDALLKAEMRNGAILEAAVQWKDKRNPLMHSMANDQEPWSEMEKKAELVAKEGKAVARDMASAVMRFRKKRLKGK